MVYQKRKLAHLYKTRFSNGQSDDYPPCTVYTIVYTCGPLYMWWSKAISQLFLSSFQVKSQQHPLATSFRLSSITSSYIYIKYCKRDLTIKELNMKRKHHWQMVSAPLMMPRPEN